MIKCNAFLLVMMIVIILTDNNYTSSAKLAAKNNLTSRCHHEYDNFYSEQDECGQYFVETKTNNLNRKNVNQRIYGGRYAELGQFPSFAFIEATFDKGVSTCGGTILSKRHIMTAAHCVMHIEKEENDEHVINKPKEFLVRTGYIGPYTKPENAQYAFGVSEICVSPKYNGPTLPTDYDLAIIKVDEDIEFNEVQQPACLPEKPLAFGETAISIGAGLEDMERITYRLKYLPVVKKKCVSELPRTTTCLTKPRDNSKVEQSCMGDSGSPTLVNRGGRHHVVGSLTMVHACGDESESYVTDTYILKDHIVDLVGECS